MGKIAKLSAAALSALGAYALAAQAQDAEESGVRMTLDVNQQLSSESNAGLTPGGEPSTTSATTQLTFNLTSVTPIDTLSLTVGSVLRVLNSPTTDGTEVRFDDPSLRLSFDRDVGVSSLSANINYSRTPVEFTRPLSDFTDPDTGDVVLPEDLDDLQGTGDRINLGYAFGIELGKEAPLGFSFNASENILRYSDTTDPGLFRTERRNLGVGLRATVSPVLETTLNLTREDFEAENVDLTDRTTDRLSFGLTYSASQVLTLTGGLGYSRSETDEGIGAARATNIEDGLTFNAGANYEMPNGSFAFSLTSDVDQNARRNTIELSRDLDLPTGALSASIGLTRGASDDTHLIGSVNWRRDLPTGSITAQVSRSVTTSNDDDDQLSTGLNLGYTYEINDVSSFGLSTSYSASESTAGGDRSTRSNASITYALQLSEDWNLNSGIEFRRSDTATAPSASSRRVFVGLGRRFDLRP